MPPLTTRTGSSNTINLTLCTFSVTSPTNVAVFPIVSTYSNLYVGYGWCSTRAADYAAPGLTDEECQHLAQQGYLDVSSVLRRDHERVYRIPAASGSEVIVREHGKVIEWLCLQSCQPLSTPAWVAMQKLLIVADERAYLSRANHWSQSPGQRDTDLVRRAQARERIVAERLRELADAACAA